MLQTGAAGDETSVACPKLHAELGALQLCLEQTEEARARAEHRNAQLRAEIIRLQAALAEAEEKIRALTSIERSLEQPEEASEIP
jgi:septal ring factor EnvC (AmiA/AmiB activator)